MARTIDPESHRAKRRHITDAAAENAPNPLVGDGWIGADRQADLHRTAGHDFGHTRST